MGVSVTVTVTATFTVTVTGMDGVLKTPVDIANRKMPAKAHNFHLRALKWVCV